MLPLAGLASHTTPFSHQAAWIVALGRSRPALNSARSPQIRSNDGQTWLLSREPIMAVDPDLLLSLISLLSQRSPVHNHCDTTKPNPGPLITAGSSYICRPPPRRQPQKDKRASPARLKRKMSLLPSVFDVVCTDLHARLPLLSGRDETCAGERAMHRRCHRATQLFHSKAWSSTFIDRRITNAPRGACGAMARK
jgi:hypothetical protein